MNKWDFSARKAQLDAIIKVAEGNSDRKSPERKAAARAQRKLKAINAVEELLANIKPDTKLSEDTVAYIESLQEEYKPGVKLDIQIGDDLIELLEEYKDVKDLYKKILKWCDSNGAQLQGTKIVKK